jgi:hypothetical protein
MKIQLTRLIIPGVGYRYIACPEPIRVEHLDCHPMFGAAIQKVVDQIHAEYADESDIITFDHLGATVIPPRWKRAPDGHEYIPHKASLHDYGCAIDLVQVWWRPAAEVVGESIAPWKPWQVREILDRAGMHCIPEPTWWHCEVHPPEYDEHVLPELVQP